MSDIANSGDQPTTAGDATPTGVTPHADVQAGPARPERTPFPGSDEKREKLVQNVKDAMLALPIYFRTSTSIEGLEAGDLFSLNSVLGGTIEVQTVATLNRIREVWDPDDEWTEYGFERSSQTFPDVRLVSRSADKPHTVLGIELKGWYLLSKEGEPSFRYTASRDACSEYDLLVVVPWRLSNVLSGVPVVYEPFIEQAMFASDLRNFYWEHDRGAKGDTGVTSPKDVHPYPAPKSKISDKANSDSGSNFGRVARVSGLMDDYCERLLDTQVSGIGAKHWVSFFKTYSDNAASDQVDAAITRAFHKVQKPKDAERTEQLVANLSQLRKLLSGDPTE